MEINNNMTTETTLDTVRLRSYRAALETKPIRSGSVVFNERDPRTGTKHAI